MGIDLIPMPFFVDGETYLEGKDCTPETFFQRMKRGRRSAPPSLPRGDYLPVGHPAEDP